MQGRRAVGGMSHIGSVHVATQRPLIIPKKKAKRSIFELFLLTFFALFIMVFLFFASLFLRHKMHNNEPEWAIEAALRRDSFLGQGSYTKGLRGDHETALLPQEQGNELVNTVNTDKKNEVVVLDKGKSPYTIYPHSSTSGPSLAPTTRTYFGRPCNQPLKDAIAPPGYSLEKYLCLLPTHEKRKIGLKQDLRVLLDMDFVNYSVVTRPPSDQFPATNIVGEPRGLLMANNILMKHPLNYYPGNCSTHPPCSIIHFTGRIFAATSPYTLEDIMEYMKHLSVCYNKPIFLTMATVGDDLYWQLIENFVYTMVLPHT